MRLLRSSLRVQRRMLLCGKTDMFTSGVPLPAWAALPCHWLCNEDSFYAPQPLAASPSEARVQRSSPRQGGSEPTPVTRAEDRGGTGTGLPAAGSGACAAPSGRWGRRLDAARLPHGRACGSHRAGLLQRRCIGARRRAEGPTGPGPPGTAGRGGAGRQGPHSAGAPGDAGAAWSETWRETCMTSLTTCAGAGQCSGEPLGSVALGFAHLVVSAATGGIFQEKKNF